MELILLLPSLQLLNGEGKMNSAQTLKANYYQILTSFGLNPLDWEVHHISKRIILFQNIQERSINLIGQVKEPSLISKGKIYLDSLTLLPIQ